VYKSEKQAQEPKYGYEMVNEENSQPNKFLSSVKSLSTAR